VSRFILSAGAEADLNQILEFIAQDSLDAADRWIEKLFDAFELISGSPGIGHMRKDLTSHPVLFWPVGAYLVIYRSGPELIEIVAVTPGSKRYTVVSAPSR
jgi:plasmid stabilization system protein ParE